MRGITPSLKFDKGAKEAVDYCLSGFKAPKLRGEEFWPDEHHLCRIALSDSIVSIASPGRSK